MWFLAPHGAWLRCQRSSDACRVHAAWTMHRTVAGVTSASATMPFAADFSLLQAVAWFAGDVVGSHVQDIGFTPHALGKAASSKYAQLFFCCYPAPRCTMPK
eukprot:4378791-Amphidinium_carterae.1